MFVHDNLIFENFMTICSPTALSHRVPPGALAARGEQVLVLRNRTHPKIISGRLLRSRSSKAQAQLFRWPPSFQF